MEEDGEGGEWGGGRGVDKKFAKKRVIFGVCSALVLVSFVRLWCWCRCCGECDRGKGGILLVASGCDREVQALNNN